MNRTLPLALLSLLAAAPALAQSNVDPAHKYAWQENCGWINFRDAGSPVASQGVVVGASYLTGYAWGENIGWVRLGDGAPADGFHYTNPRSGSVPGIPDYGVNRNPSSNELTGFAWSENCGWINFGGGAQATPPRPAMVDTAARRLTGYAWAENIGWINLDNPTSYIGFPDLCPSSDFDNDGDFGTDFDIQAFFACLGGHCCPTCGNSDFNGDGDFGTDLDIQSFFSVLGGGPCLY